MILHRILDFFFKLQYWDNKGNLDMDCILDNSIVSMINFLSGNNIVAVQENVLIFRGKVK